MDSYQGFGSLLSRKQTLKPIDTRRSTERKGKGGGGEAKMGNDEITKVEEEPSSPAARLFHSPRFYCCIVAIMGLKTKINVNVIKMGLEDTLLKHPRFSSIWKVVNDKKRWRDAMDSDNSKLREPYHIPNLDMKMDSPDQFIEDYVSDLTEISMDLSKPLWELHLLNIKTSDANAVAVFRFHHSIGDGASLIPLLLACCRKTSNPEALPTIPTKNRTSSSDSSKNWWSFSKIWSAFQLICNTLIGVMWFSATVLFLKDTETPLKGAPGIEPTRRRFVHRTVSLDDIKLVKTFMNMTVNDVLLGVTQAALSRYLNRRYCEDEKEDGAKEKKINLPERIRIRAVVATNLRPSAGIQALADMMKKESKVKWGNSKIGYVLLPFKIALLNDPLDHIRQAKAIMDRKKHSLEAMFALPIVAFIGRYFGVEAVAALSRQVFCNTTLSFSNVVGPLEEITFRGHPVAYIAPSVYGLPHALTIHFQSYVNKMTIVMAVDQDVIPDPHQLCDDLEESLKLIKNVVVERGFLKNGAY